ncbi:MAG: VOC family protein [Acidimicrobiia bacterium]
MHTVNGFSHLAIAVEDLDRSLHFYCDLLGLTMFHRYQYKDFAEGEEKDWDGADYERGFALVRVSPPSPDGRTPFLSITDHPRGSRSVPEFWNWGIHHFGVWVANYDEALARLEAAGVSFAAPSMGSDSFNWAQPAGQQIRTFVVRDPDGNLVQLDEITG